MRAARVSALALALIAAACGEPLEPGEESRADAGNAQLVSQGEAVYVQHCASCHGVNLEGQPDWRQRLPNGRLPAPPHDESGHTWHHPDQVLFAITKNGLVPPYAPAGYASDMPAFAGRLTDDGIWAVLAFLKTRWTSPEILAARAEMTRQAKRK